MQPLSVADLPHIRHAWTEITRLAKIFSGPGHRIRVNTCEDNDPPIFSGARGKMTPYVFEVLKDGAVVDKRHQDLARFGD